VTSVWITSSCNLSLICWFYRLTLARALIWMSRNIGGMKY